MRENIALRRPLAVFGGTFFLAMLVVVQLLGTAALWVAAGVLAAALAGCLLSPPLRRAVLAPLVVAAILAAVLLRLGYDYINAAPRQALAGATMQVTARVLDAEPGHVEDTVNATLQLVQAPDAAAQNMQVQVYGLPQLEVGELVELELRFSSFKTESLAAYNLSKGYAVSAMAVSQPVRLGYSHTFLTHIRRLQYAASENIRSRLPSRLSGTLAAMPVADRRYVPDATTQAFRSAGISHMLVVSGLHLSILASALYAFLLRVTRRRRLAAGCGIAFILLFMAFTGFGPSIVRSGLV